MNDDDLKELLDAARDRGKALARELPPPDLGLIRSSDVAVRDFIAKQRRTDLESYFKEDVKALFGDSYNVDKLYDVVGHQYVEAFLKGVRFP